MEHKLDVQAFFTNKSVKKTWNISTSLPVQFEVKYSTNILSPDNKDLLEYGESNRRLVAIDRVVYDLNRDKIETFFAHHNTTLHLSILDCTEQAKNWQTLEQFLQDCEKFAVLRRAEPIIAMGGGVLLDIVGFGASIYRRGIPYIRVPTTLLALVDASVGAKTAVNHFDRRNRLGSYYPPIVSYLDKTFIKTQDQREICNGLAEIFKLALIKDQELFCLLEGHAQKLVEEKFQFGAVPVRVINSAISGMIDELRHNLWEKNLERCVDFGHSFSPLIEILSLPELLHGEAVCLDCIFSAIIAHKRNLLTYEDLLRIITLARDLHLPTYHPRFGDLEVLHRALDETTRHRNGNQYLALPCGIGSYIFCNDLQNDEMIAASIEMKKLCT